MFSINEFHSKSPPQLKLRFKQLGCGLGNANLPKFTLASRHTIFFDERKVFTREKNLTPTGLIWTPKCPPFHCFTKPKWLP